MTHSRSLKPSTKIFTVQLDLNLGPRVLEEKKNFARIAFRHCNRKNNKVVDYLVKIARNSIKDHYWTENTHRMAQLVNLDRNIL